MASNLFSRSATIIRNKPKDLAQKRDLLREKHDLKERFDVITQEEEVYKFQSETTVVTDIHEVFGRDQEIELIKTKIFVDGMEEDVKKLNNTYESVTAALMDAEKRQLTEETVRVWVERLRDISYEIEDVLDVWKTVHLKLKIIDPRKAQNHTGFYQPSCCSWLKDLAEKRDLQREIADLTEWLDVINQEKEVYKFQSETTVVTDIALQRPESSAFDDVPEVFGRDQEIELIKTKLLTSFSQESNIDIISIVGMGGMGKTTIALLIFNEIEKNFERMIWVCVSDPYNDIRVAKSIIEELGGDSRSSSTLQSSLRFIRELIIGKRFMLVLDDVWTKDPKDWKSLFNVLRKGARGSKILVTSRNMEVARVMESCYTLDLEKLSEDESWKLFSQIAFSEKSEDKRKTLEEVGKSIAKKCEGLPLALKTLASHLKFTAESEWHKVLHSDLWKLEAAVDGIFVPLLFSYYELPLAIKKCFSYCAIFPKDHHIKVNELVKLWMSQDYLKSSTSEDMETTGENYFQHLVTRSFFQDIEYRKDTGGIRYFKMHDIVHDFAQFLSKDESLIIDMENKKSGVSSSSCIKLSHLTVLNAENSGEDVMSSSFSSSIQRLHLHSLRLKILRRSTVGEIDKNFQNLSQHLCFIKALDLSESEIVEVPERLGQFVHLRYLDLSWNSKLKRLPGTIYELCNLQTLLLDHCASLRELPEGIEKLINLRHLETNYGAILPKGIGSLCSLRTLSWFTVGRDEGHGGEVAAGATIGDLKNLINLQGCLSINNLRNVKDGREARKTELRNKRGLTWLSLKGFWKEEGNGGHEKEVIEALEPCHSLEKLEIWHYSDKLLPSWISLLSKLRILGLYFCYECEVLPPLGRLPSLESLHINWVDRCKRIGEEFLGIRRGQTSTGGGRGDKTIMTSSVVVVAFPKLKKLFFRSMRQWTEWEDVFISGENDTYEDDLNNFKLFPCLDVLSFRNCPQLRSLPQFISKSPVQTLGIWDCPILGKRCRPETGEDWSKLSHIPNIKVYNEDSDVFEINDGQLV